LSDWQLQSLVIKFGLISSLGVQLHVLRRVDESMMRAGGTTLADLLFFLPFFLFFFFSFFFLNHTSRLCDSENLVTSLQSLDEIHHLEADLTKLSDSADLAKLITAKEATYGRGTS
jgi:hypothetical protein